MGKDNMISTIKEIHPKTIIIVKVGSFYHVYGKDAYILSYLFGYQIKTIEKSNSTSGFPLGALPKVLSTLEDKKINYIVVYKSQNYEVDQEMDFRDNNRYDENFEKSYKVISLKARVNAITEYFMENLEEPNTKIKIQKTEEILFGS